MALIFAEIIEYFNRYFADSLYPLLFIISLAVIFFHPGAKRERDSLALTNLLFILIIFCPLSACVIMKMVGSLVYWRMFWMLNVAITAAYAGTELIAGFSKKAVRILAGVLAVAAVCFSGQFILSGEYFTERENPFKIPTEAIYVAEAISAHADEQEIESPKAAVTSDLAVYIRQYDAGIRLAYGRNMVKGDVRQTKLYTEINSQTPNVRRLVRRVRKKDCEYLVMPAALELDEELAGYSFIKIDEVGGYAVYFDDTRVKRS